MDFGLEVYVSSSLVLAVLVDKGFENDKILRKIFTVSKIRV